MYGVSEEQYVGQYGAFFKVSAAGVFKVLKRLRLHQRRAARTFRPRAPTATFMEPRKVAETPPANAGWYTRRRRPARSPCSTPSKAIRATDTGPSEFWCRAPTATSTAQPIREAPTTKDLSSRSLPLESIRCSTVQFRQRHLDGSSSRGGADARHRRQLYGVGPRGGTKNAGAIFKITPAGNESILYNFCSVTCNDGFCPTTPLVLHTDGKFYGNTNGNSLGGSVFYSFDVGFKPLVDLVTWSAKVGKTVEILGQGFTGTTGVSFDGVAATFNNISDTYMTATVPAGALTGTVTVTTFTEQDEKQPDISGDATDYEFHSHQRHCGNFGDDHRSQPDSDNQSDHWRQSS